MAWTAPRTWVASETVTATNMNLHVKDNLNAISPLSVGPAWTTWTPTLTNMTLGNGTVTARYTQIGKTVTGWFVFVLGSTSTMGSGPTFSTPVNIGASLTSNTLVPIGRVKILDSGTQQFFGACNPNTATTIALTVESTSGTYNIDAAITATIPMTWAVNDAIACFFQYESV